VDNYLPFSTGSAQYVWLENDLKTLHGNGNSFFFMSQDILQVAM